MAAKALSSLSSATTRDGTRDGSKHTGTLRRQPGMGQGMGQIIQVDFGDNPV